METAATYRLDARTRRRARRGLSIYFAIVVVLSAAIEVFIISNPELNGLITGLMLLPALASEVARLVLREGFADVSFHFGGQRSWSNIRLSLIFPVVIGLIAYGIAWTSGLAGFDPPTASRSLVAAFILVAVGMFVSLILVSGEEIGWRGYMLSRLIDAGVPYPVLVSGLIWGLWHVPLVLAGMNARDSQEVNASANRFTPHSGFPLPAFAGTGPAIMTYGRVSVCHSPNAVPFKRTRYERFAALPDQLKC